MLFSFSSAARASGSMIGGVGSVFVTVVVPPPLLLRSSFVASCAAADAAASDAIGSERPPKSRSGEATIVEKRGDGARTQTVFEMNGIERSIDFNAIAGGARAASCSRASVLCSVPRQEESLFSTIAKRKRAGERERERQRQKEKEKRKSERTRERVEEKLGRPRRPRPRRPRGFSSFSALFPRERDSRERQSAYFLKECS